jgi:hypothetical protein
MQAPTLIPQVLDHQQSMQAKTFIAPSVYRDLLKQCQQQLWARFNDGEDVRC